VFQPADPSHERSAEPEPGQLAVKFQLPPERACERK
jgi:hypothetical protein